MKKYLYILPILVVATLVLFLFPFNKKPQEDNFQVSTQQEPTASLANPASQHCEDNGGNLEIVTESDGSQFGLCNFADYSCEEWAYFNGECDIENDAEKIKQALINKGLNLTDMKVVIKKHLGQYIEGAVLPVSAPAGGGYVFAVKQGNDIKVLADGNGAIMCTSFDDYPDFSTYLVPECIDEAGNPVSR